MISIHAPRTGSDDRRAAEHAACEAISIHAPRTGSDGGAAGQPRSLGRISIHAPRTGSDDASSDASVFFVDFNPRSPHGERPLYRNNSNFFRLISIHAPRTGSDVQRFRQLRALLPISIHAPRTGSDHPCASAAAALPHFNPRSPHGERRRPPAAANLSGYFNPRSPHGERPYDLSYYVLHQEISIHAPRTGSDFRDGEVLSAEQLFQSTLPARGATYG